MKRVNLKSQDQERELLPVGNDFGRVGLLFLFKDAHFLIFIIFNHSCLTLLRRHMDALRFDLEQVLLNALRYNESDSLIVCQAHLVTSLALKALSDPKYSLVRSSFTFFSHRYLGSHI